MRKILLLSLALLPLMSISAFSAEVADPNVAKIQPQEDEPLDIQPDVKQETKAEQTVVTDAKPIEPSTEPLPIQFDSLRESELAKIVKLPGSYTWTQNGLHIVVSILNLLFNPKGGMNVYRVIMMLNDAPRLIFEKTDSPESQIIQNTQINVDGDVGILIDSFAKQDMSTSLKAFGLIQNELQPLMRNPSYPAAFINTVLIFSIRINSNGKIVIEMTKATKMLLGLQARIYKAIEACQAEQKAYDDQIWQTIGNDIAHFTKDEIRTDVYALAELLTKQKELKKQSKGQGVDIQKLEILKKKQKDAENAREELDKQKITLEQEIAIIESAKSNFEKTANELQAGAGSASSSVAAFKAVIDPFMAVVKTLPENLIDPYNALESQITTLSSGNTTTIRRQRTTFFQTLQGLITTTKQDLIKKIEALAPQKVELEKKLSQAVTLTPDEQEEAEQIQTKIDTLSAQIATNKTDIDAMKTKLGELYSKMKFAALTVQNQKDNVKSEDTVIKELNIQESIKSILNTIIEELDSSRQTQPAKDKDTSAVIADK